MVLKKLFYRRQSENFHEVFNMSAIKESKVYICIMENFPLNCFCCTYKVCFSVDYGRSILVINRKIDHRMLNGCITINHKFLNYSFIKEQEYFGSST